jgi:pseudouridylate synthase
LSIEIRADVREALSEGTPVVALESTLISHGLPRPENLSVAREAERAVRAEGAVPATIGVIGGTAKVGLDEVELELLAGAADVPKLSARDLPVAAAKASHGATTVAATAQLAALAGIRVFATGGLGGVHRGRARVGTYPRTSLPSPARPWPSSAPGSSPSSTFQRRWSTWRPWACPS